MTRSIKTQLIGLAAALSLVAGAALSALPAKAQGYVGDIRSARIDHGAKPADWPEGSEERERARRRDRSERVYLVAPPTAAEAVTAIGVAGRAPDGLEARIGRDAISDRQHAHALGQAKRLWRERVAELYGERSAAWERATEKRIQCTPVDGEVECEVSAVPGG